MQKSSQDRFFEAVVVGDYYAFSSASGSTTLKNYRASFILPSQEAALSVICRHLLEKKLKSMYPDFIRFRTHKLESLTLHGHKPNPEVLNMSIDEMTVSELSDFCILNRIMIDPFQHSNLQACKEKVTSAYQILRQQRRDKEESKTKADQKQIDELLGLNQLPADNAEMTININEQKALAAKAAPRKPSSDGSSVQDTRDARDGIPSSAGVEPEDAPLPDFVDDEPSIR